MNKQPSFIQIGETYYATIKTPGSEDILKDPTGQKLRFDSATRAMNAAIQEIANQNPRIIINNPPPHKTPEEIGLVTSWRQDKLRRRNDDRDMATMLGIEVVTKRRRVTKTCQGLQR